MLEHIQPDNLQHLAMASFINYTYELFLLLIAKPENRRAEYNIMFKAVVKHVQEIINTTELPLMFLNEITSKLLKNVDELQHSTKCWFQDSVYREILEEYLCAIIHPEVTKIELAPDSHHMFLRPENIIYCSPFICNSVNTLNNLKVLRLGFSVTLYNYEIGEIDFPEHIEEFSLCGLCNDCVLNQLSKKCTLLKQLTVSWSQKVTDASVEAISKFSHLELLHIECTGITEEGLSQLLRALGENHSCRSEGKEAGFLHKLKSLGLSNPTNYHLNLIADKFPKIHSLKVKYNIGTYSLSLLKSLKHLQSLSVIENLYGSNDPIGYKNLFAAIGKQLVYLNVVGIAPIDIKFIGANCLCLQCFHINSLLDSVPSADDYSMSPLPGFKSVICLDLELEFDPEWTLFLLCQCINVKKLHLAAIEPDMLYNALQRDCLRNLEEIFWAQSYYTEYREDIIKLLADKCQNLKVATGFSVLDFNIKV